MALTGLFGGAFDPPHVGHVALARGALEHYDLARLLVLVVADPGHRDVEADAEARVLMARAAFGEFPRAEVRLEESTRTVEGVRGGRYDEAVFLVGADEFADFPSWKEPDEVLEHVRLGVATRPGFPAAVLERALASLRRPERVEFFEIEPTPVASTEIRARVAAGREIEGLVPSGVARLIAELGLYRRARGLN